MSEYSSSAVRERLLYSATRSGDGYGQRNQIMRLLPGARCYPRTFSITHSLRTWYIVWNHTKQRGVRLGFYEVMRLPSLLSNTDATNEAVRRDTMPLLG